MGGRYLTFRGGEEVGRSGFTCSELQDAWEYENKIIWKTCSCGKKYKTTKAQNYQRCYVCNKKRYSSWK